MKYAIIDFVLEELVKTKEYLKAYSKERCHSYTIEEFRSGEEFLEKFTAFSYDMILIEINLKSMDGIETAKGIRRADDHSIIVFLTSSSEHMQEAFSCHAFDYIVKPVSKERLYQTLDDAVKVLPKVEKNLTLNCNGMDIRVRYDNLVYLSTTGHYTEVVNRQGDHFFPYITYKRISTNLVQDSRFLQINKCILVNMQYIVKFEGKDCHMIGDKVLPVNIRNAKLIEQTWRNYKFRSASIAETI